MLLQILVALALISGLTAILNQTVSSFVYFTKQQAETVVLLEKFPQTGAVVTALVNSARRTVVYPDEASAEVGLDQTDLSSGQFIRLTYDDGRIALMGFRDQELVYRNISPGTAEWNVATGLTGEFTFEDTTNPALNGLLRLRVAQDNNYEQTFYLRSL